ncbi:hypothetical protein PVAND_008786 [Polypedilum vanderplanki]|uniref:GH16 domain-containing protein n=1 Tax=Polypedilum vanderplanki TaxID=319348 RepID=A0A9J6CB22_POLVA|nr:hypothetical protein PVAND_008786 [Polypedilum vanderplanki]
MLKALEFKFIFLFLVFVNFSSIKAICIKSLTTVYWSVAPKEFCSGEKIFEDNFDNLNRSVWLLENSLGVGGGSKEFQWYTNDPINAYTESGILHIKPTLTADIYGEEFLYSGNVFIPKDECTQDIFSGCNRTGSYTQIINPIRSVRMNTMPSFSFKFGTVEIRAKNPTGDWLFPAIWLNPKFTKFGPWPMSGEIDIMESRGNLNLFSGDTSVGADQISTTLHFGPKAGIDGWRYAHFALNDQLSPFNLDFHVYKMIWTPRSFEFYVDNKLIGIIDANQGFFKRGKFSDELYSNPWSNATIMAPFDQEFYVIIDLAVGGTSFFSDYYQNLPLKKPWLNNSTRPAADFWENRKQWLPTWQLDENENSHMLIDYVKIWAL